MQIHSKQLVITDLGGPNEFIELSYMVSPDGAAARFSDGPILLKFQGSELPQGIKDKIAQLNTIASAKALAHEGG